MVTISRYNVAGALSATMVSILSAASFALPWYHHWTEQTLFDVGSVSHEDIFYLEGKAFRMGHSSMPGFTEVSPWSTEVLDSFMDKVTALVALGVITSIAPAILVLLGYRRAALLTGVASAAILASSVVIFCLWFGNALPSDDEYKSFFSETTTSDGLITTHEVWGPLAGWWLVIVAVIVQCFTVLFATFSERR